MARLGRSYPAKQIIGHGPELFDVTLTGSLFTKAPTFFTGAVTATYSLTGALFTKAPTFFTGTVTATLRLENTFEGGSDGTAITTANSGGASGDAFDAVTTSGTGAVVFDDDAGVAAGTFSALVSSSDASISAAHVSWSTSWQVETEVWTRIYFRTNDATPTTNHPIVALRGGGFNAARVEFETTGVLGLRDAGGTLRYSSSLTLTANTLYRIEFHVIHSTTVGHMEARLFHGANLHGTTADETFGNLTDNWNTRANSDTVLVGRVSSADQALSEWFDEIAIDNSDWIGPAAAGTQSLAGVLFTKAPTFPTGAVSLAAGPQTVNGVLFTKAPTFPQGAVASTYALTGTLFVKAPTFFTGTVTSGAVTLTGVLFVKAPTFPQGVVTAGAVSLTGVLFQKAPTFPTGTVTTTVGLTGSLFVKAPTFFTGTIGQAGTLFGNLFVKAPTFFTGSLAQGGPSFWMPDPAGWTANPAAFVRVGRYGPSPWGAELSGQRFEKAPTFPVGTVT